MLGILGRAEFRSFINILTSYEASLGLINLTNYYLLICLISPKATCPEYRVKTQIWFR
jgi:hypothetical protein